MEKSSTTNSSFKEESSASEQQVPSLKPSVVDQINQLKSSKLKETRVLLVTLQNNVNNTVLQHNKYYQSFSQYGEVQRILIFQKISPWATFIEMDSAENARLARQELNNTQILPDGTKYIVLPSTKERIEFQEKNSSGIDYIKLKQKILEKQMNIEADALLDQMLRVGDQNDDDKKGNSPIKAFLTASENNDVTVSYYSSQSSNTTANSANRGKGLKCNISQNPKSIFNSQKNSFQMSFSDGGNHNQQEISDSCNNSNYSLQANESSIHTELQELNLAQSVYSNPNLENNQSNTVHHHHHHSSNQILLQKNHSLQTGSSEQSKQIMSTTTLKSMQNNNTTTTPGNGIKPNTHLTNSAPSEMIGLKSNILTSDLNENVDENTNLNEYTHPQFVQITKKSKVIYANRFDPSKTNMLLLFNLFSAFGNIVKIIFMKSKHAVLIEYSTIEYACYAKDYLGDKTFNGNVIKIFYSRYENIFFKPAEEKPEDEEYFEPNESINRFKSDAQAVVNPPIDTLHISNIRRDDCNYEVIKKIIEPYGSIKSIKFMLEKNNKNMCLVKFESTSIAMQVLANVHNFKLSLRPLKISFSKRTLDQ